MNAIKQLVLASMLAAATLASAQDALRPAVGEPLLAAQKLMQAGDYKAALAKVKQADAVPDRTPYENYILDRMRASAAAGAGNDAVAVKSYEAVLASGRLQASEQPVMLEALAAAEYRLKDYAKAESWAAQYVAHGGNNPQIEALRISAGYLGGDYAGVAKLLRASVDAKQQAGAKADENTLKMLAACYAKLKDDAGYGHVIELLLQDYPSQAYWADRIAHLQSMKGFPDALMPDLYRLERVTGTLTSADQYVSMAELLISRGLPTEAKSVLDAGYSAHVLGAGAQAPRQQRLLAMATRQAAQDHAALAKPIVADNPEAQANTGQALVVDGQLAKGIALMRKGLATGSLRHPNLVRLHIGQALLASGDSARAAAEFDAVHGDAAINALARLWAIRARQH